MKHLKRLSLCIFFAAAACSGGGSGPLALPNGMTPGSASSGRPSVAASSSCSSSTIGCLYVPLQSNVHQDVLLQYMPPFSDSSTPALILGRSNGLLHASQVAFSGVQGTHGPPQRAFIPGINDAIGWSVLVFNQPFTATSQPAFTFNLPDPNNDRGDATAFDPQGRLFVGDRNNGQVYVFAPPFSAASKASFTITNGLGNPLVLGIQFDRAGNLYVAYCNFGSGVNGIQIYAPPYTGAPKATISQPCPWGLAFDAAGNLYASEDTLPTGVDVYRPPFTNSSTPAFTFGNPNIGHHGLTFDAQGNLYALETSADDTSSNVAIYTPPFNAGSTPNTIFPVPYSNGPFGPEGEFLTIGH
jgi:hypothetical protein